MARKKNRKNSLGKISPLSIWQFIWHEICYSLPFWQFSGKICHFGSSPSLVGVLVKLACLDGLPPF